MPGNKMTANMRATNFIKRKNSKKRQQRKDKGRMSDLSIDSKKARQIKLMAKVVERRRAKKELKESKMSD